MEKTGLNSFLGLHVGGPVDKNPLASAGTQAQSPLGKSPHALEQLSSWATATEPALQSSCPATREATAVESPHAAAKAQQPKVIQKAKKGSL